MKALRVISLAASGTAAVSKDDVIFIISILIVIFQMIQAYLERKKDAQVE
jgi:hypothetical protein